MGTFCGLGAALALDELPTVDLTKAEPQIASMIAERRAAVLEAPESSEAWGTLAGAYHAHGLFDAAEACYEAAIALAPDTFEWVYLHALVRDVNGADEEEIGRRFEAASRLRPDYVALFLRRGRALAIRGAHEAAIVAYRRAIELDAASAAGWSGLGQSLIAVGKPEQAVEALGRARSLRPEDRATHASLAQALHQLGRHEEAADAAARAANLRVAEEISDPVVASRVTAQGRSARHWIERAERSVEREEWPAAIEAYETLATIRPDDAHVHYSIGSVSIRLGRAAEGRAALERALALDPGHAWARFELASLAESAGRTADARELLDEATALQPSEPAFAVALARVCSRLGDWSGVDAAYRRLDEGRPIDDPAALSNWGNALVRSGRDADAIAVYERALTIDAGHANTHYNLGLLLERAGRAADAAAHFEEAVRRDPSHPARLKLAPAHDD